MTSVSIYDNIIHSNDSRSEVRLTHSESPLDTLARRTSSKKVRKHIPRQTQQAEVWGQGRDTEPIRQHSAWQHQPQPLSIPVSSSSAYSSHQMNHAASSSSSSNGNSRNTGLPSSQQRQSLHDRSRPSNLYVNLDQPSRTLVASSSDALHSPLLHSHFPTTRDSVTSVNSYYYTEFNDSSRVGSPYDGIHHEDRNSGFSVARPSWGNTFFAGAGGAGGGQRYSASGDKDMCPADDTLSSYSIGLVPQSLDNRGVRVSDFFDYYSDLPDDGEQGMEEGSGLPTLVVSLPDNNLSRVHGRAPVVKPVMANFSRPTRESGQWRHADAIAESATPQLPPDMRDQKKVVLERNAGRLKGKASSFDTPFSTSTHRPSPLSREATSYLSAQSNFPSTCAVAQPQNGAIPSNTGHSAQITRSMLHPPPHSQQMQQRSNSSLSLYSNYSYYQYDGLIPSPTPSGSETPDRSSTPYTSAQMKNRKSTGGNNEPRTPEDYLQLGIQHHEANRLQDSVQCFERSAKEGGGCGVGMLMYGLALRHGWGCAKNEALGFKWVRKAAESAVEDLEKLRTGQVDADSRSVQAELVLAIYEVGQCFFHGWGVVKDQKMAVSYYMVAARLGDGDAQGDLAFCLANGKGCKKNKKEAARWYRAAVQQGQSDVGLAWIYKEKYQ